MFDKQRVRPILLAGAIAGFGGLAWVAGAHAAAGGSDAYRGPRAATRRPARSAKNFARLLDGLQPHTDLSTNREHRDRSETLRVAGFAYVERVVAAGAGERSTFSPSNNGDDPRASAVYRGP